MRRVLVVEDDSDVQSVIIDFLQAAGYGVLAAASAEEARPLLAQGGVDLALIDCLMKGEQGVSLAEHAAKLAIPVILTSGDPNYLEIYLEAGGEHSVTFLPKPFRLQDLEQLIAQTLAAVADKTA